MLKLIINADDFGLSPGINAAIRDLFERGIITNTSALACSNFIEEGIAELDHEFKKKVGMHICLDEEKPISDPMKISSLVNKKNGFFKKRLKFIQDLFLVRISKEELYREIKAQITKIIKLGIHPDHIDSHGHLHVLPNVADVISQLSKEYDIRAIRKPINSFWVELTNKKNIKRLPLSMAIMWASKRAFKNQFGANITTEAFIGLLDSGHVDNAVMKRLAKTFFLKNSKTIEIMCHPGVESDGELQNYRHWKYEWQKEYQTLLNMKDYFRSLKNVRMISFKDLTEKEMC